jgi:predicted site-specific integrase-resolvase
VYLTPNQVYKKYGYHPKSLARWADEGKLKYARSPGGHRRYLVESLENMAESEKGETVLYARVSTNSQKDDLKHQQEYLGSNYPGCKCISDIGSGLNFKRRKFINLMEQVSKREISTIVVAHKDRLCRFGFDFVEWFCTLNNCQFVVLSNSYKTPHQELMDDFMSIMHCFSSQLDFLRRYEKQIRSEKDKV